MGRERLLSRVLGWLRKGYPEGIPQQDYVVLLGLLRRRLTPEEVQTVADEMLQAGQLRATKDDIRGMIQREVLQPPLDEDVNRVAAHLAAGGWPLAEPFDDDDNDGNDDDDGDAGEPEQV